MSEYRAAIGRFADIAKKASCSGKRKWKRPKLANMGKIKSEETHLEKQKPIKSRRSQSLGSEKSEAPSCDLGRRSRSLRNQTEAKSPDSPSSAVRMESPNPNQRRQEKVKKINDGIFKTACISCKTDLFDQLRKRGRAAKTLKNNVCPHANKKQRAADCSTEEQNVKLFACFAISVWFTLERAVAAIVQMLLVRSGIETNPGPTNENNPDHHSSFETKPGPANENNSICCNASQHFNRVKKTIAKTQKNFESKVLPDSLSKKVIEIEETGMQSANVTFYTNF